METTAHPAIKQYMTYQPNTIRSDQTLEFAQKLMRELGVRHLPVLRDGELIGILSERDINLVLSFESPEAAKMSVEEACTYQPFSVGPEASLKEVVSHMAEKKIGSAVVMEQDKVVGIFTDTDALRALSELLQ